MSTDFNRPGAVFCEYLLDRIKKSGSGASEEGEYVFPDRPRDNFFIGRLSPSGKTDMVDDILENTEDFFARLNPYAMRARFLLRGSSDTQIVIEPSFHVYVRVFPKYEDQKADAQLNFVSGRPAELLPAFQRVHPGIIPLKRKLSDLNGECEVDWNPDIFKQVPQVYRGQPPHRIDEADLASNESYATYLKSISGPSLFPDIKVSIIASVEKVPNETDLWEVSLALVNRSNDSDPTGIDRRYDEVVFDAGFETKILNGFVVPYEFPSLPKSYRFDRRMFGTGVNCTVVVKGEEIEKPTTLSTTSVPTYKQARFDHRELPDINITFDDMAAPAAVDILRNIAIEMRKFEATDWEEKGRQLRQDLPGSEQEVEEFERDKESFRNEIERFEQGIDCLENPLVARAFSLMNCTFRLMGEEKNQDRWRLFQIVFIVSLLPSVAGREFPQLAEQDEWDYTDVIWFPTGGGKTEAYLGLTVFAMFFDRLRGRVRGMTALYRFPLRLLSLQQFQRIVRTVAAANRIKSDEEIDGKQFTVGHWIGSGGSPNQIGEKEVKEYERDPNIIKQYRKLTECPNPGCGNRDIQMKFDKKMMSLQHVCPICGILPVLIVDHELYRYPPSIVVGTVDKMAVFGQQRRFSNLMGWTRGFCNLHGYAPEDQCEICGKKGLPLQPIKDPVPSLHIQDELHLMKEDLGAFDSHYESSIIEMQRAVPESKQPWKTIAATATIEDYDRHVEHLYLHNGRRFPTSGPSYEKTFYAQTDNNKLSRLFAGIIPSGLTHINAMVAILWYFQREIAELRVLPPEEFLRVTGTDGMLSEPDVTNFIDQYEISLNYVLTKKSGDQMAESLDAQVGNYLNENELPDLVSEVLTGGTTSEKITEITERIEKLDLQEPNTAKRIRAIIATSMISHGVDIERFNFITFFGMPRMTSEYIQASSRVGRMFPGIVIVCFAPARERDRSHYHLFTKYHEYLERLVEPAAINRWSRFSIGKTIAGVVLGYIVNELARETGRKLTTGRAIKQLIPEMLTEEKLRDRIQTYYGADQQISGEFYDYIASEVAAFINGLPNTPTPIFKRRGWKPMRSLRDTDREVTFRPAKAAASLFELILKNKVSVGELERRADYEEDSQ